jgi:hypothetical protein
MVVTFLERWSCAEERVESQEMAEQESSLLF